MDLGTEPTDVVQENLNTTILNTTNTPIQDRKLRQHYSEWTNGAQTPLTAEIDCLKDQQLGRCLAHHQFIVKLELPADWFQPELSTRRDGYIMIMRCWNSKGKHY
eukprot:1473905-Rhodomonas_salina.2